MAGLPNITGTLNTRFRGAFDNASGAISVYNNQPDYSGAGMYSAYMNSSFNASLSNPIYGSSITVTPLSMSCKFYISY